MAKLIGVIGSFFLGILFLASLPFVALAVKLFSSEPIIRKVETPGRRGITFRQYLYPTTRSGSDRPFYIGNFLHKSGIYKLPSVINVMKGQMNLIGPAAYPAKWSNYWNKQLSDYYKRYSLNPGIIGVGDPITDPDDIQQLESSLEDELQYILNPTFKKDLNYLFGMR